MKYVTTCTISFKGDRVRPGTLLEMDAATAANLGTDVRQVDETPAPEPAPEEEKALEEITAAELKEKAAALGLSTSGSKADLLERIVLHVAGGPAPEEEA
jgi:hypothetical protein